MKIIRIRLFLLLFTFIFIGSAVMFADSADLVLVHGHIYTGVHNGGKGRFVEAIAISSGKVLAVGSDAEVAPYRSNKSKVIDLGGHFAMPGFNDAHTHLAEAGGAKLAVVLNGSKSLEEMLARIEKAAATAEPGQWILGEGWDHTVWRKVELPTRQELDKVTNGHPAFFGRVDGHIAVANSAALKAAGITSNTPDPQGGKFDHDANGELTGIVRENAKSAIEKKIPPPTPAVRRKGIELALADAVSWGVTSAQDYSSWQDFEVYEQLEQQDKLPLRITEWLTFNDPVKQLKEERAHHAATDAMLHTGMLKGFMDGSLGSGTAAMLAPYSDNAKDMGIPYYKQEQLDPMAAERVAAGFQLGFHAIGDAAVRMALNAFEYAEKQTGKQGADLRFRIEHSQVVAPGDFARYKTIGVIASMQPNHLLTDMNWAEARLGPERAKYSYAWREFLKNGVPLAFGTDYPVEPITPFRGLYAAVTRMNEAGTKTYPGDQTITIWQALDAYTTGSAYAEFAEKNKGTLVPGKYADIVVLDRDLTAIPPHEILGTKVLRTIVGGDTVYQSASDPVRK
ncbi:MAG: amidohydrolase family protein [Acidobacteriaceae bacterium]